MRCHWCGSELPTPARGRPRRYCGRSCQARAYRARRGGDVAGLVPRRPISTTVRRVLDPPTVVAEAIRLADADGLAAVSVRALAGHLGVATMTLYRHVSSKAELVAALVDTVFAELRDPPPLDGWRAQLTHQARQERALYRRHPWVLPVIASTRPPLGRSVLAVIDQYFTALAEAGFNRETAHATYLLVSSYVQGFALLDAAEAEEHRATGIRLEKWWQRAHDRFTATGAARRYAWLAAPDASPDAVAPDAVFLDTVFEYGLQRVLDGIAVHHGG